MENYTITCLNNIAPSALVNLGPHLTLTEEPSTAAAWLVRSVDLHEVALPSSLLAIGRAGAGVNTIPLDKTADQGIVVFNTPGANANGVAELVLAIMISGARNLPAALNWVRELDTDSQELNSQIEAGKKQFVGHELRGRTLGVIGLGAVGHRVANSAVELGMRVYGYDPYIPVEFAWKISGKVIPSDNLEELLSASDYVTIHVPLMGATRHMINSETLDFMKDGAILLNYARDGLVDEDAVQVALAGGQLGGYRSDFPTKKNLVFPNTILTPHLGASTYESEENCATMAIAQLQDWLVNGNIKNSVNYPDVTLGVVRGAARMVILHRNKPNALNRMTALFGEAGYNIDTMVSNSRGNYACALFDLDKEAAPEFALQLQEHPDILRVRVINGAR